MNGAAKTLLNFCDTVQASPLRESLSVSIATFHRGPVGTGSQPPNEFVGAARARGLDVRVIPEGFAFDPRVIGAIRELVRSVQPDIVQTNNVKSHVLIAASGVHTGRKWVAFHHGYTATDFKVKVYNQFDRWSLRRADRVVTVCGPFRDQLVAVGVPRAKIRILHNSVALPAPMTAHEIHKVRADLGIGVHEQVLLTIGRLSYEKGHADLMEALGILKRQDASGGARWKLLLVGSGPEQANLQKQAQSLGIEQRVIFAGQQTRVEPYYGVAQAMVLPSHSEGSPHVVLEAMAAEVPIVATRVGGVPEILTDGETALLLPPQDPQALAQAIFRTLQEPQRAAAYARTAKQQLLERFTHQAYLGNLAAIYEELAPAL